MDSLRSAGASPSSSSIFDSSSSDDSDADIVMILACAAVAASSLEMFDSSEDELDDDVQPSADVSDVQQAVDPNGTPRKQVPRKQVADANQLVQRPNLNVKAQSESVSETDSTKTDAAS